MFFHKSPVRKFKAGLIALSVLFLALTVQAAQAQEDLPQNLVKKVGFDQNLDEQIPLDLIFTDSLGQEVRLGYYFGDKPVILALGYYECPMLCSMVRGGLVQSIKEIDFTVGEEFEVLIVSIDPNETPDVAEMKRQASIMDYGRSTSGEGWNFLVSDEDSVRALADAIGFQYAYDENIDQYVHPSGIVVLTPGGKIARYFYGIDYPQKDLRLGLVEAAENKIGSPVDQLLLTCYHYDPVSGEYTLTIMNIIRLVGSLSAVAIGAGLIYMLRNNDNNKPPSPQSV